MEKFANYNFYLLIELLIHSERKSVVKEQRYGMINELINGMG